MRVNYCGGEQQTTIHSSVAKYLSLLYMFPKEPELEIPEEKRNLIVYVDGEMATLPKVFPIICTTNKELQVEFSSSGAILKKGKKKVASFKRSTFPVMLYKYKSKTIPTNNEKQFILAHENYYKDLIEEIQNTTIGGQEFFDFDAYYEFIGRIAAGDEKSLIRAAAFSYNVDEETMKTFLMKINNNEKVIRGYISPNNLSVVIVFKPFIMEKDLIDNHRDTFKYNRPYVKMPIMAFTLDQRMLFHNYVFFKKNKNNKSSVFVTDNQLPYDREKIHFAKKILTSMNTSKDYTPDIGHPHFSTTLLSSSMCSGNGNYGNKYINAMKSIVKSNDEETKLHYLTQCFILVDAFAHAMNAGSPQGGRGSSSLQYYREKGCMNEKSYKEALEKKKAAIAKRKRGEPYLPTESEFKAVVGFDKKKLAKFFS